MNTHINRLAWKRTATFLPSRGLLACEGIALLRSGYHVLLAPFVHHSSVEQILDKPRDEDMKGDLLRASSEPDCPGWHPRQIGIGRLDVDISSSGLKMDKAHLSKEISREPSGITLVDTAEGGGIMTEDVGRIPIVEK